ncbi:MAG: LamG domain-containing protein [Planctomycetes bacterium]|nr:LamG domain-containing protein [Planctomycetota bacterium]
MTDDAMTNERIVAKAAKATLGGETVEPRILLSASWLADTLGLLTAPLGSDTGGAGDDYLVGTAGSDTLDGGGGDDVLQGLGGDDTLIGGAGTHDVADYSAATAGVTVDLSAGTASGGAGNDTLSGIEAVSGSAFDDTFAFTAAQDGDVFSVLGNGGDDVIDLSGYRSSAITFGDGEVTVDLGAGSSFKIEYADIDHITFGDIDAHLLTGDVDQTRWSGHAIWVDGAQAFELEVGGSGTIDWSYDAATDSLSITDQSGTSARTDIVVTDLNGQDLAITDVTVARDLGSLTTNVDIGTVSIGAGNATIHTITIDGGAGRLDNFLAGAGSMSGDTTIHADVGTILLSQDLNADFTVDGDVGAASLNVLKSGQTLHFTGDLGALNATTINGDVTIDGNLGTLNATRLNGTLTVGGDVGTLAITDVRGDVAVAGDLDNASFGTVDRGATVSAGNVQGAVDLSVGGTQLGRTGGADAKLTLDGATMSVTAAAPNSVPIADAGLDLIGATGDLLTLDAGASSDADSDALTYKWVQTGGPAVTLSDPYAVQPTFSAPDVLHPTTLEFTVTVGDGTATATDTVLVLVNPANLLANWSFEGSGQTVTDVSGNGNDGMLGALTSAEAADPTRVVDPERGNVLHFDGGDVVGFAGTGPAGNFSVSAWAKDDGTGSGNQTIYATMGAEIWLRTDGSKVMLNVGGYGNYVETAAGTWSAGEWHHVTGTWDGTTAHIYIDGVDMALTTVGTPSDPVAAVGGIGNLAFQGWTGEIDDVRVYGESLGASTVTALFDNLVPLANAGIDQAVGEDTVVTLDAGSSYDPEGRTLTYTWTQISGPAVVLSDTGAAQSTFTAPQTTGSTTLQFQVEVSDGVNVSVDTVDVTVAGINDVPIAEAGPNQQQSEGGLVTLDGRGSIDPDGGSLTYSWRQISGPTVTIVNADQAVAGFVVPEGLTNSPARFELTVSDGVNRSVDVVQILMRADNDAPTANAGNDQIVNEGDTVRLDGRGSTDPENQTLTYSWRQISGPTVTLDDPTAARPRFTAPELLTNTPIRFELTVSDGTNTSTDSVLVLVGADNDRPAVDAGADLSVGATQVVALGATASDPEGQGLTYIWTQVSGPKVTLTGADTANPTFTSPVGTGETLVFAVAASDGVNTSIDTVAVHIENTAPVVVTAGNSATATAGDPVVLGASASDVDGDALTYRWSQVGGPSVMLGADDQAQTFFQAPKVTTTTQLIFRVEVNDGDAVTSQLVTITIEPDSDPGTVGADDPGTSGSGTPNRGSANATTGGTTSGETSGSTTEEGTGSGQESSAAGSGSEADPNADSESGSELLTDPFASESDESSTGETQGDTGTGRQAELPDDEPAGSDSASDADGDADSDESSKDRQGDDAGESNGEAHAMVAAAGSEVEVTPLLALPSQGLEDVQYVWKQLSGTEVRMQQGSGPELRIELPETFTAEELVFQVEMMIDGEVRIEEVTVQIQPVDGQTKAGPVHVERGGRLDFGNDHGGFEAQRGIGKLWASLVAFSSSGSLRIGKVKA